MAEELRIIGDYVWDRVFSRTVDRLTSEQFKLPPLVLMENAGRDLAEAVLEIGALDAPVIVLAGLGGNGGDALVAARYLAEAGCDVHSYIVANKSDAKANELCRTQIDILRALHRAPQEFREGCLRRFADDEPIVIDGILGLGFQGSLDEEGVIFRALAEAATLEGATVVAVDLPSGMDCDSGEFQEIPLPADVTVTFGGRKPAHILAPARDLVGDVLTLDIGFPAAAQDAALGVHRPQIVLPDPKELVAKNPWSDLARSAHKFDRGHVLVIGGSAGKTGAPLLAAMSALRAGAGWATVAMPDSATASLRGDVPRELTFEPLFDGERLNPITLARFLDERKVKAVVAGPGSVQNPLSAEVLAVLADYTADGGGFVVLDAGATHGIAPMLDNLDCIPEKWLLTPHPGEWTKLGPGFDVAPLTTAGIRSANAASERLGVSLLYKHATPILVAGSPKAPAFVSIEGTLALARAGSGDILAGVIAAHGAAGLTTVLAALRSQVIVAWAATLAAEQVGEHGVLARDIISQIGKAQEMAPGDDEEEDEEDDED